MRNTKTRFSLFSKFLLLLLRADARYPCNCCLEELISLSLENVKLHCKFFIFPMFPFLDFYHSYLPLALIIITSFAICIMLLDNNFHPKYGSFFLQKYFNSLNHYGPLEMNIIFIYLASHFCSHDIDIRRVKTWMDLVSAFEALP